MAVFRVEKTGNFTVMANHHLRDKNLSLKAKGLLSMFLSLPETWSYSSLTKEPLAGAEFTITNKATGKTVATLTTDSKGEAISGLLRYGEYTIKETKAPAHYTTSTFSTTVSGTEHNKVYEIKVENTPTKGKIQLTKTDQLDGTPIAGVVFDIYQGSTKVGSMTTNSQGIAISGPLPKGKYTVKESGLPTGYTGSLASLDCEVKSDETTELKAANQPIQFQVKIIKTDGLTKEPLPGSVFTVTRKTGLPSHNGKGDGEVVATLTTNAQGEAVTDLLTWGTYEIKETKVPEHFVDKHYTTTITGTEDKKTYEIQVENEPTKGWIQLIKTDRLDGTPISGVVFDILQNGKIVSSMTTGADGVAKSEALNKGKYTVKEHANPTGYTNELLSLDCEVLSDTTTKMTADNQPIQGKIKIVKKDELTKATLAGAEFTITRVSGLPSHDGSNDGEVVAVLTTDASGMALSPLLTWGTYQVTETKVPAHYVDNHFSTKFVIKDDMETIEVPVENEPTKGWIQLVKTDALDRTPIAGVQFDIYYNDDYGSGLAATMITNAEGVAKSPALRKGKYLVWCSRRLDAHQL